MKELAICEKFQVSRTPARQAFSRLPSEGLVQQVPNVGAFVRKFSRAEVIQLMETRRIQEAGAAAQAAEKIDATAGTELMQYARNVEPPGKEGRPATHRVESDALHLN